MSKEADLYAAWQGTREEYDELRKAMQPAIALLREYVESVGGCDHDVGICICDDKRVLEDAERIIGVLPNDEHQRARSGPLHGPVGPRSKGEL